MLPFLKKRRYRKTICSSGIIGRINRYLSDNYTPPEPPPRSSVSIRYSVGPSSVKLSGPPAPTQEDVQHNLKETEPKINSQSHKGEDLPNVRYSVGSNKPFDDYCDGFTKFPIDEIKRLHNRPAKEITADLESILEMSFVDKLLLYINEKKLRDTQIYKAAHIDRKLFSKIASNRHYTPSKDTCLALCFALQLSLEETKDLLSRAEHALTHSNKRDIVIEYLIRERIYDLFEVNEILDHLGMKPFGP